LQERAKYLDEWQPLADIYEPWRWDVSQKSDVWGVGLAALYLLWAGKGEEACLQLERDIRDESAGWINEFNDNVPSDESIGDNEVLIEWIEMYEFDPAYSIGLVHLVRRCPESPPNRTSAAERDEDHNRQEHCQTQWTLWRGDQEAPWDDLCWPSCSGARGEVPGIRHWTTAINQKDVITRQHVSQ
jgi:hypothetical protein